MTVSIVDPFSSALRHLASVDVKFSGFHIGNGIYFSANHNPSAGTDASTATPQSSLTGQSETHATTEYDYTLPDGGAPWDAYRDDLNNDGTLDFVKAGFDMSLHVGDTITGGGFYDGPSVPILVAMDQSDLSGTVYITGFPRASNALDGNDGTMHETSGTLAGYTEQDIGGDVGGYFTVNDAEVLGGMSGGGGFMELDLDGDGTDETYVIGSVARSGTIDVPGPVDPTFAELTAFAPHYWELAADIEALGGDAARSADGFARMTLLSGQSLGSSNVSINGTFFHEDMIGGVNSDKFFGAGGDDSLFGAGSGDALMGGDGNDTLDGGTGDDTLTGGAGNDLFTGFGSGATDRVLDFDINTDVLDLADFFADFAEVQAASTDQPDGSVIIDISQGSLPSAIGTGFVIVDNLTTAQMTTTNTMVVCFVAGTEIKTAAGSRPVEDLRPGDLVWTLHRGWQPLRARHVQRISASAQRMRPTLRPIRIAAGSLGPNIPERPLVVSRQHRIYLNSIGNIAVVGSGVLAAACALTDVPGISVCDYAADITYVHLAFDHHEIICAEGCLSESFFRGAQALAALPPILAATYTKGQAGRETPAAPIVSQKEARRHVARARRKGVHLQVMPRKLEASA